MPYIDLEGWYGPKLVPLPNETFVQFAERLRPAIKGFSPTYADDRIEDIIRNAWADFVFKNSMEMTITLKRSPEDFYAGHWYMEAYFGDWTVTEIISATPIVYNTVTQPLEMAQVGTGEVFKIAKSQEDEQLVFGWANIAIDTNGHYPIDWDGDITDPSDLEKAAYNFVLKYRATGENHQGEVKGDLVESIMFTKEKQAALGIPDGVVPQGWWVGFHVPDKEVFAKIKSGEYEMFSVEGTALRKPVEGEGGDN